MSDSSSFPRVPTTTSGLTPGHCHDSNLGLAQKEVGDVIVVGAVITTRSKDRGRDPKKDSAKD